MKRGFDLVFGLVVLVVLSPIMLATICAVFLFMGRPVFFVQERPGLGAKPFRMIKFRTMLNRIDKNGSPLADVDRLNRFGKLLRSTSIDELPGLLNVIRGEMSLVGPRPLLMQYVPLYSKVQMRRHEVRPGITGWAQVNGRNSLTWEEKFALDVWYVDNRHFGLDIWVLILTIKKALVREGIAHEDDVTMPFFLGDGVQARSDE